MIVDLEKVLRKMYADKDKQCPEEWQSKNRAETADCAPLDGYPSYHVNGWPEKLKMHVKNCHRCQRFFAVSWPICPKDVVLKSYINDTEYINRLAIEWHTHPLMGDCASCRAKITYFKNH